MASDMAKLIILLAFAEANGSRTVSARALRGEKLQGRIRCAYEQGAQRLNGTEGHLSMGPGLTGD
jgi:hypothetical protein